MEDRDILQLNSLSEYEMEFILDQQYQEICKINQYAQQPVSVLGSANTRPSLLGDNSDFTFEE